MENQIIEMIMGSMHGLSRKQIEAVLKLVKEGNTVPFIARYRKEMTGSLDEVSVRDIISQHDYAAQLIKRKEEIVRLIDEQGKLTPELQQSISEAKILQHLEDIYRPYKQKRRTKATIAKEKGLEPIALRILQMPIDFKDSEKEAFINPEMELNSIEDVNDGIHEIICEVIGDIPEYRQWIRDYMLKNGTLKSTFKKGAIDERKTFEMYYEFTQPISKMVSHRVLAVNRGENEGILKVDLEIDDSIAIEYIGSHLKATNSQSEAKEAVIKAIQDAYKRFILPAIEREVRNELTQTAQSQAIKVFGENLKNLLLQAPIKNHIVMGFDPAYRTGCKLAIVDQTGKVLNIDVIYPHATSSSEKMELIKSKFAKLVNDYKVDTIAIGNGTASRESEVFVAETIKEFSLKCRYVIVSEAGASVYSASDVARVEFPDLQVEQRSAISIARRLQDPLAELVKIDPKSVGVGQYQHDVSQKELSEALDFVVETAVNRVGVDVNTASPQLLSRIAGLTKTTADNIVKFREKNGRYLNRNQIKSVPRLGPKSYEQAIGFLRIPHGENILDSTSIHPESYPIAKAILKNLGIKEEELEFEETRQKIKAIPLTDALKYETGLETFKDVIDSLLQPGRDMRDSMTQPLLRSDVVSLEDMTPGMKLQGTIRNVVDFGAFVDIGVKQDGLVHISKLSKSFVKNPSDIVSVGDIVTVWVIGVDIAKQRVQLSMINEENKI